MENIRNRVDIKLVNNKRKAEKFVPKPNFKHLTIFDEISRINSHEPNKIEIR